MGEKDLPRKSQATLPPVETAVAKPGDGRSAGGGRVVNPMDIPLSVTGGRMVNPVSPPPQKEGDTKGK